MLKKIRNSGILALALAAGMAVLQPASAAAAERHDRDSYRGAVRVGRNWNGDRHEYRDNRGGDRDHGRVYTNYAPAPRYSYGYYPAYGAYPYCPR